MLLGIESQYGGDTGLEDDAGGKNDAACRHGLLNRSKGKSADQML